MKYKAAVVGCGRIGFGFDEDAKRRYIATHTGAYKFVKETELVAVCDINEKRLKKCINKLNIPRGYADFKEMLKKEKIDILSISTPVHTHYIILKEAVNYSLKAIFCEKPLAGNVKDAEKMVKLCQEKEMILQVDHQRRFDPLHVSLRKFIITKKMGKVQQVNVYYTAGVNNTGSHIFDLLRFFFGEVDWINGFYSKNISYNDSDPNIDGFMKFKNGLFASFQACDVKKYLIFEINCLFEQGRIVIKNSGFDLDFYRIGESKYFSRYRELYNCRPPFNIKYKRNFMVGGVKHLLNCIRTHNESISSGIDGLAAMKIINSAICSAKNKGRRVFIK